MLYDLAGFVFLLFAAHVVCDWPLQPADMSAAKRPGRSEIDWRLALGAHSLIHGGAVALVTGFWPLGVAEMASHAAIDAAKCRHLIGMKTDQALHLGCKIVWAVTVVTLLRS